MGHRVPVIPPPKTPAPPVGVFCAFPQFGYTQAIIHEGEPMFDFVALICIGVVIAVILAVVVTLLLAYEEYKKQQKKPPE